MPFATVATLSPIVFAMSRQKMAVPEGRGLGQQVHASGSHIESLSDVSG